MYPNNACCSWRDFADALKRCWNLPDKIVWQWVLYLLADNEISVGKAREWLREWIQSGINGVLPEPCQPVKAKYGDHIESAECWCHPTLDYTNPETGVQLWIHHKVT
jgi:hypothetical protein